MAQLIAVVNLKGGVGKTNIAVNLACELSSSRSSVVLVDADAQGTATFWASQGKLPIPVHPMPLDGARDAAAWANRVLKLDADYIVLDAPPHVGAVTEAIIGIADLVLVPVTPSAADLAATSSALDLIRDGRKTRKDGGPRCLLVPSKVDRRTAIGNELEGALKDFGEPVGPTIHQRTSMVDALGVGMSICEFAAKSPAHEDISALAKKVKSLCHNGSR